ncbi:hypothetical protein [Roseivivax sediminis]|uniref:Uncharacterized protein n=1 Tax=Roseivivax sediminis TaxID=936889 RepID=A0A1I2C1N0_9RHOB|nr:hypothetical protein [Roseivivax sediminis]SFE61643.1 hypothetical protein SAMN04515678_11255 [Roseivivax sediminis]
MIRTIVLAACLALSAGVVAAQSCSEIRFARGAVSGDVSGRVGEGAPMCFTFGAGAGQTARVQLFGSDNTCFNVAGVIDCQDDYSFRTRAGGYRIDVHQLFRSPGAEQFTLRLTIR